VVKLPLEVVSYPLKEWPITFLSFEEVVSQSERVVRVVEPS